MRYLALSAVAVTLSTVALLVRLWLRDLDQHLQKVKEDGL